MGFGLLFIGYLFAFGFTSGANYIVSIVGIVGSVFLFTASKKLSLYSTSFKVARYASGALGVSYTLNTVLQLLQTYGIFASDTIFLKVGRMLIIASVFFFNFLMYKGIADIAVNVGDKKLSVSAYRDLILMIVYYLFIGLSATVSVHWAQYAPILSFISTVLGLIWLVLSVWLVMSAYMRICLPGDEDMPMKTRNGK